MDGVLVHCHVRIVGISNWRFALLFRDYLRAQEQVRYAYAQVKKRLTEHYISIGNYAYIKDPICDLIYLQAEQWANATHWIMSLGGRRFPRFPKPPSPSSYENKIFSSANFKIELRCVTQITVTPLRVSPFKAIRIFSSASGSSADVPSSSTTIG